MRGQAADVEPVTAVGMIATFRRSTVWLPPTHGRRAGTSIGTSGDDAERSGSRRNHADRSRREIGDGHDAVSHPARRVP